MWGEAHKLVPVAFGVKKLVLSCVVEDDKVRFFVFSRYPSHVLRWTGGPSAAIFVRDKNHDRDGPFPCLIENPAAVDDAVVCPSSFGAVWNVSATPTLYVPFGCAFVHPCPIFSFDYSLVSCLGVISNRSLHFRVCCLHGVSVSTGGRWAWRTSLTLSKRLRTTSSRWT